MYNVIREAFECISIPNFPSSAEGMELNENNAYIDQVLEDHWQTFQDGWEAARRHLEHKSDIIYYATDEQFSRRIAYYER